jgi:GNAT superfamily N-acetyltransferase
MTRPPIIQIRPAAAEESGVLTDIAFAAKCSWKYPEPLLEQWRPQLTISPMLIACQPTWVAGVEGALAGFASVVPKLPFWELEHLWVLPAHSNNGIGRQLLEHALAAALVAGACGLAIDSDPNAEGFYRRCGAVRIGETAAPIPALPDRVLPRLMLTAAGLPR